MAGRDNLEVTIYGMEGVPPNLIEGKYKEVLKKTKLETKEDRADPSKMNPFNGLTTPFISTGGLPIYATASQIVKGQMHAVDSIPNFMAENPNRPHPLLKQSQPTEAAVPTPRELCATPKSAYQMVFEGGFVAWFEPAVCMYIVGGVGRFRSK